MLLTDKYADKIYGIIACYDRMIIQGYIPNWNHADAMTAYMKASGISIFDYPDFSQPLTEQVLQNAERIASENGIEIEFIRKLHAFRKDDRIQKIISETGKTEGLVHIFSAMECCNTYRPCLAHKLDRKQISYRMHDNSFLEMLSEECGDIIWLYRKYRSADDLIVKGFPDIQAF